MCETLKIRGSWIVREKVQKNKKKTCAAVKVVIIYSLSAANNTDTVLNTERQMQEWRNWQTRTVQVRMVAIP